MVSFRRCQACVYQPLAQHTSVRPPPWLPDGEHHVFYVCKVCGSITVQAPDNQGSHSQLWMLEPGAMALLRTDVTPSQVIKYIASDDFFNNRAITDGLFRFWVRAAIDVSMCVNALIAQCGKSEDPRRLSMLLDHLVVALNEVHERMVNHGDVRCRISSIDTILAIAAGRFPHTDVSPKTIASIRLCALDALDLLARPGMTSLVSADTLPDLDYALDHGVLVETSRQDIVLARQRMHSDGAFKVCEEAIFLRGVFERRDAHLTTKFGSLMWGCLLDLHAQMGRNGNRVAQDAYVAVQALLQAQLLAFGLEPISWHTNEGASFQNPRTHEVFLIRRLAPQVEIYASVRSTSPTRILDAWFDVLESIRA